MSTAAPAVAVVVATRDRPQLLGRCLDALRRQTLDGAACEIVVVDDGRSDATRDVVLGRAARAGDDGPALRYLRPPPGRRGAAAARNAGWRASSAPLVAFTDDDAVPDADWLRQGLAAMAAPHRVAASGRIVVPVAGRPTDHARATQRLERAEFSSANAFVQRDALARVGGFDERFTRPWRADADLYFSLLDGGGAVGWAPRAVVVHPVRDAPWGIALRRQRELCFDALLYRKHPQRYRQKIRRHPPWGPLVTVLGTLVALAAGLLGQRGLAAVALGLAAAGIAGAAGQRLTGTSRVPAHVAEVLLTSLAEPYLAVFWRLVGSLRFRTLFP